MTAQTLDFRIGSATMGSYGCIHWPSERDGLEESISLQSAFTPAFISKQSALHSTPSAGSVGCRAVLACWYRLNDMFLCHRYGSLLRLSI